MPKDVEAAFEAYARLHQATWAASDPDDTDAIRVRVTDDGKGFDPDAPRRRGFGLTSMRERAEVRGGVIHVTSEPDRGTVVEVVLS